MSAKVKNILLTLLALALLVAYAAAIPSPAITPEAEDAYWGQSVSDDDEYAFLFD
ncbi:MAG: hypothetical protein ACI4MK_12405 [Aristaeellaceae bacterium]